MGNCFVKREALPNNCPAIYPDAQGLFSSSEGSFEPLETYETHVSSSLDFNGGTCSSSKDLSVPCSCSVNYAQIDHDSVIMKTAIQEEVSVGGSVKERSCKLANLLEKSFVENDHPPMELVTARFSPILLSPLRKPSGKSSSVGLEVPVHSKSESPRTKFVGLIMNHLGKSLSSVRSNSGPGIQRTRPIFLQFLVRSVLKKTVNPAHQVCADHTV
ncbi:hypothetical protein SUGI_0220420 [Cryptomeria japonica]|nr:hypothetical protein SUGI_0220420 [Cryptomeria japonica]